MVMITAVVVVVSEMVWAAEAAEVETPKKMVEIKATIWVTLELELEATKIATTTTTTMDKMHQ